MVRRGLVRARVNGVEQLMDPTTVFVERPGTEQRFSHPPGADVYTEIVVSEPLTAALLGGDPAVPEGFVPVGPRPALAHRILLADARHRPDAFRLAERAVTFTGDVLAGLAPAHAASAAATGARRGGSARIRLANDAREALAADRGLGLGLAELARLLHCSPYHVSRVFRAVTGGTLSGYRGRLRTARALDRLEAGERDSPHSPRTSVSSTRHT